MFLGNFKLRIKLLDTKKIYLFLYVLYNLPGILYEYVYLEKKIF